MYFGFFNPSNALGNGCFLAIFLLLDRAFFLVTIALMRCWLNLFFLWMGLMVLGLPFSSRGQDESCLEVTGKLAGAGGKPTEPSRPPAQNEARKTLAEIEARAKKTIAELEADLKSSPFNSKAQERLERLTGGDRLPIHEIVAKLKEDIKTSDSEIEGPILRVLPERAYNYEVYREMVNAVYVYEALKKDLDLVETRRPSDPEEKDWLEGFIPAAEARLRRIYFIRQSQLEYASESK